MQVHTVKSQNKDSITAVVPNLFLHQGPVSWKTIFPWTGGGEGGREWSGDDSSALHLLCTLFLLLLHCNI